MTQRQMTLKDVCGYVMLISHVCDLADSVDTTLASLVVQHVPCSVNCTIS